MLLVDSGIRSGSCDKDKLVCFGVASKYLAVASLVDSTACTCTVDLILCTGASCKFLAGLDG